MLKAVTSIESDQPEPGRVRPLGVYPLGVYYGWWVMLSLMLCGMVVYGAGLYGFTLFVPPLSKEFGWSPASTAGLVSIFWLSAPLSLLAGTLYNRFGALKLICFGTVLEAVCLASLGFCSELWQMYVLRALMGVGKVLLVTNIPIVAAQWFSRRFGVANAFGCAGLHLGGLLVAPLTYQLLDLMGWREACFALSAFILIVGIPPVVAFLRVKGPEHFGVGPDGLPISQRHCAAKQEQPASGSGPVNTTWFVRTATFWLIILGVILTMLAYSGLLTNYAVIAQRVGMSAALTAEAIALLGGAAFIGALTGGFLTDRFRFKYVILLDMALMFLGIAATAAPVLGLPLAIVLPAAVMFGLSCGGTDVIVTAYVQQRFSGSAFPYAFGAVYFVALAVMFAGPILIGFIIGNTPDVLYPLGTMVVMPVLAVIVFLIACTRKSVS